MLKGASLRTNGVLIRKDIHKHFHSIFGFGVKTSDFAQYLIQYHQWGDKPFPWEQANHEPSSSVEEIMQRGVSYKDDKFKKFVKICVSRKHTVIKGEYLNVHSPVTIKCEIHQKVLETTFHKYTKCKHGLRCCGTQALLQKKLIAIAKAGFLKNNNTIDFFYYEKVQRLEGEIIPP